MFVICFTHPIKERFNNKNIVFESSTDLQILFIIQSHKRELLSLIYTQSCIF